MHPVDRYQIGDEICGQVERMGRKAAAFEIASRHAREHNNELRVRVIDCMAHKRQYRVAWEFWVNSAGTSFRSVTNLELGR